MDYLQYAFRPHSYRMPRLAPWECVLNTLPNLFAITPLPDTAHNCHGRCVEDSVYTLARVLREGSKVKMGSERNGTTAVTVRCDVAYTAEKGGWRGYRIGWMSEEDAHSKAIHKAMTSLWWSIYSVGYHNPLRTLRSFSVRDCGLLPPSVCSMWMGYPHELPVPHYHTDRFTYMNPWHPGGSCCR